MWKEFYRIFEEGKRKKLLEFLKNKDIERYREIIKKLNIRK
ncbi:MAG TPA: 30S ribosomal protein S15 [Bacteroidales bacterium]|nr:30S ribosomal protein S15 [Bacteroidales bacterium]